MQFSKYSKKGKDILTKEKITVWLKNKSWRLIESPTGILPLTRFRILFGALMMFGGIRFIAEGWIEKLYLEPQFFFKFYGFEWVENFDERGMYFLLYLIIGSAAMVMIGFLYRLAIIMFFVSFTYLELIDATNYLNHYYLVCLLSFLMIFLPAHHSHSVDVLLWKKIKRDFVPSWTINILIVQLTIVYTFAGIAKLNFDWLFQAMPLAMWLPEHQDIPVLGYFFQFKETAFLMSWAGAIYDLTIAYFLMFRKTRPWAYAAAVIFHLMTWMLFNIGLFPLIMIFSTLIFFPAKVLVHQSTLNNHSLTSRSDYDYSKLIDKFSLKRKVISMAIFGWIFLQIFIPLRHHFYPGNVLWTEEGYRFSWRVMVVEKSGLATFTVKDPETNRQAEIINSRYLTPFQEKQMSIQPDFILQFAHFLKRVYHRKEGIQNPIITVDAHVALNGRVSHRLIDEKVNLANVEDGFLPKKWILAFYE